MNIIFLKHSMNMLNTYPVSKHFNPGFLLRPLILGMHLCHKLNLSLWIYVDCTSTLATPLPRYLWQHSQLRKSGQIFECKYQPTYYFPPWVHGIYRAFSPGNPIVGQVSTSWVIQVSSNHRLRMEGTVSTSQHSLLLENIMYRYPVLCHLNWILAPQVNAWRGSRN